MGIPAKKVKTFKVPVILYYIHTLSSDPDKL